VKIDKKKIKLDTGAFILSLSASLIIGSISLNKFIIDKNRNLNVQQTTLVTDLDVNANEEKSEYYIPQIVKKENGQIGLKMFTGYVPYFIGEDKSNVCGFWGVEDNDNYTTYWLSDGYSPEEYMAVEKELAYSLRCADSIKDTYAKGIEEPIIELDRVGEQNNGLVVPYGYMYFYIGDEETYCFNKFEKIEDGMINWSSQDKPLNDYVGINGDLWEKVVLLGRDECEKTIRILAFADKTVENMKKIYGDIDSLDKTKIYIR